MAAVRFAARRLGGALLQPTQAAVAEEGRLLAPASRLMCSRPISTKHARAHSARLVQQERLVQQKKEELYDAVNKAEEKIQELLDLLSAQSTQGPTAAPLSWEVYSKRARGVINVACKVTAFVYAGAFLLGITGIGKRLGLAGEVVVCEEDEMDD